MTEVLPKLSHASKNAGGSSRREKGFHARGKRRTNGVGPKGGSTNGRPKGKKINDDDEQIEEGRSNKGDDDQEEDIEGENERREENDMEGCDNADDNGKAAAVRDDSIGCKKQRGSEDAYMLIYVREGVDWGIGGEEKEDVVLPEHVLVSQGL